MVKRDERLRVETIKIIVAEKEYQRSFVEMGTIRSHFVNVKDSRTNTNLCAKQVYDMLLCGYQDVGPQPLSFQ